MNEYYPKRYREDLRRLHRNFLRDFGGRGTSDAVSFNGHLERKHFIGIPVYQRDLLIFSLILEVLIDEIIYTYFKNDYDSFINSLEYPLPKFEFCGHGRLNRNPFSALYLLEHTDSRSNLVLTINTEYYRSICGEVISNLRRSMREREFSHLNMENIQKAIEGDTDVMNHELGKIFNERLKSNIFSFNRIRERRERRN